MAKHMLWMVLSALILCCATPAVLSWIDMAFVVDVPLFCGLLYPFIVLPVLSVATGIFFALRTNLSWAYPVLLFLAYLPMVFLLFNASALFHCAMAAVPALAGVCIGRAIRYTQRKNAHPAA